MAQIEWQSYEWALRLEGHSLKDLLIDQNGFGARYRLLMQAVAKQNWTSERKMRAEKLWRKAKCFSKFRNLVAHNPVIANRNYPGTFMLVDAHSLKGDKPRNHRCYFPPMIYSTATRMQALAGDLMAFWDDSR